MAQPFSLLQTKLYRPPRRPFVINRPYLLARLDEQPGGRVTLLSAPAGFGKTTLVSEWASAREEGGRMKDEPSTSSFAWLSLDEGDNDLTRFWRYVIAALQQSEQRYRSVVEHQSDLVCRYLPDTTLTFVNEAYCRFFGKSREELIGQPLTALMPDRYHDAHRDGFRRYLKTGHGRIIGKPIQHRPEFKTVNNHRRHSVLIGPFETAEQASSPTTPPARKETRAARSPLRLQAG